MLYIYVTPVTAHTHTIIVCVFAQCYSVILFQVFLVISCVCTCAIIPEPVPFRVICYLSSYDIVAKFMSQLEIKPATKSDHLLPA